MVQYWAFNHTFWGSQELSKEKIIWLGFLGDEILPSYVGIIANHYKDPYSTTSIFVAKKLLDLVLGSQPSSRTMIDTNMTQQRSFRAIFRNIAKDQMKH